MLPLASLLNLGGPDFIVVLVIVLLLFGARNLPGLARGLGEAVRLSSKKGREDDEEAPPTTPLPATEWTLLALSGIAVCSMLGGLTRGEVGMLIGLTLLFWAVSKKADLP